MKSIIDPGYKVVLVGLPFDPRGIGEHLRRSVRAFRALGVKIGVWGIYAMEGNDLDVKSELGEYLGQELSGEINIFFINGDMVEDSVRQLGGDLPRGAYNVIYPMWELNKYPNSWAEQLDRFDEVWAPSRFTYESLKSAVSKPVTHMPLPGEITLSSFLGRRYFKIPESSLAFLFLFDFTSYIERKNPFSVVRAFEKLCEYLPNSDVCLVLKVMSGGSRKADYDVFRSYIARCDSRLLVIDKVLTDNETNNLLRCSDCFISLHRSEGFGLGMITAMYLGKPVVATCYSGNLDFMTHENSCLVRYDLCDVRQGAYPFSDGQVWAEPDVPHAVDHMVKLVSDPDYARELGERASRDIRVNFSYRAIGLRYLSRINEIMSEGGGLLHSARRMVSGFRGLHQSTLDEILADGVDGRPLKQLFGGVSDDFWFWLFTQGYRDNEDRLRKILPSLPGEHVQIRFTRSAGDTTLREAFSFYQLVKKIVRKYGREPLETILDFGCGWGRTIRYFLREVEPRNLWGIDCFPEMIEICKRTNPWCRFEAVQPFPPTSVVADTFDVVYAYSVFSHLSERAHLEWLAEFKRILRPGGLLIATTWPRDYILTCAELRAQRDRRYWVQGAKASFVDTEEALARYDHGEFLHEPVGGGDVLDPSFFGETCIPKGYVLNRWTRVFEFVDYIDDREACAQNVIVVRK